MAEEKKSGGASFLSKMAKKAPAKTESKSDTPTLEIENSPEIAKAVEKLIGAKKAMKQAESTIEQQEEILIPKCKALRKKHCMDTQKFTSSIKVKVKDSDLEPVAFAVAERYSDIPPTADETLAKRFGDLKERCFGLDTKIELTPAAVKQIEDEGDKEDSLINKIIAAVGGQENFEKLFKVKQKFVPTTYLHEQSVLDSKIAAMYEEAVKDEVIKPSKPSFRVF